MHTHYIDVTIDPFGIVAYIAHDSLNVTCTAVNCNGSKEIHFYNNASGTPQDFGLCTSTIVLEEEYPEPKTCNVTVNVRNNGTLLLCGVVRSKKSRTRYSEELLEILVQGQLYIDLFNIIFS